MRRGIGRLRAGGLDAQFVVPSDQSIFTKSVANTITTSRNAEIYADGVSVGTATPSLSWTPSATDLDVTLTASGSPQTRKLAVATTNLASNLTTWTATNVTATSGITDYKGGTTAYRIQSNTTSAVEHYIAKAPSPANSNTKSSIQFIAKPGSTNPKVMVDLRTPSGANVGIYDFTNGQSGSNRCWVYPVESLGNGWYRFWAGVAYGQNVTEARIYVTNTLDASAAASVTLTTSDYIDVSDVYGVDGVLPYYDRQKGTVWQTGTASVTGATRYKIGTDLYDSGSSWGTGTGAGGLYFEVLVPDTYTTSKTYRWILVNAVELTAPSSFANELQVLKDLNIHNTMDCIIVRPYAARTWGGVKSDGTLNHEALISAVIPRFMEQFYSVGTSRDHRTIMGYSAAGFAALAQLNRHPEVWGYCVAWDCPVSQAYGAIDTATYFGSSTQYDAFNPKPNFTATSWNDKARLVFGGYNTYQTDTNDMFTVLTNSIGAAMNTTDSGSITNASGKWWKINSLAASHNFLASWVTPAMTALNTLWNA